MGSTSVVGARDRHSKAYTAKAVRNTGKKKLQKFVAKHVDPDAKVYTDEAAAYEGIPFEHHTVKHSAREFVRGDVHTNNIESLWSMLKRAYMGTFHKMSDKHLNRYVMEFTGRANARELDTIDIMKVMAIRMRGRRLRYSDLIRDNGLDSGARPSVYLTISGVLTSGQERCPRDEKPARALRPTGIWTTVSVYAWASPLTDAAFGKRPIACGVVSRLHSPTARFHCEARLSGRASSLT